MAMNLETVLTTARNGSSVNITLVSNQNNGIASYAEGSLLFHPATGGQVFGGPPLRPAHMESTPASPLKMFFSDRRLSIDPPPAPGGFGITPRQPFSANQTEKLGVAVAPGLGDHQTISVSITVFGNTAKFTMERLGDVYVDLGPSMGNSSGAGYVLAFIGISNPPA